MTDYTKKVWQCDKCDWYSIQFIFLDPNRTATSDQTHIDELNNHKRKAHHPLKNLWSKRNSSSGYFTKLKRSGKQFSRLKSEN